MCTSRPYQLIVPNDPTPVLDQVGEGPELSRGEVHLASVLTDTDTVQVNCYGQQSTPEQEEYP